MFGLFEKENFLCLGVNPNADWSNMDSIITPMELYEILKTKIYSKENIKEIQSKLNQKDIPYKDIFNEFNWVSEKQMVNYKTISFKLIQVISGVRQEFESSDPHIEIYEKYIAPSIIKSLSSEESELQYNIDNVEGDFLNDGVIVPLHFDRVLVQDSKIQDEKTGIVFRNLVIKHKLEPLSLEPNLYQKIDILIDKIFDKIENAQLYIGNEEEELLEILTAGNKLNGSYSELNGYYYLGIANYKIGMIEKAEIYFEKIINLQSDISKLTIAKDFLRPIGELFEEEGNSAKALYWFKRAIDFSPTIGLKKKIVQLEK
jgi:tetratricopeptide (TPR) repeat protein